MTEKKPVHILISSTLATVVVTALTNPLDVLKVRIQNNDKNCSTINHHHCVTKSHSHSAPNSLRQASLYRLVMTPNLQEHYQVLCDCLPFRSNAKALVYLTKKEGYSVLTNGLAHGLMGSVLSTVTYFYCYEAARKYWKQTTSHNIGLPLLTALTARTITTCIAFPFEYWKTLQQSSVGLSQKSGVKLGTKINAGFGTLLGRDLLFSGLYWVLVENIRRQVKVWSQQNEEGYQDKGSLLLSNVIAGSLAGAISASVTLPLDVVKTRRQLNPRDYKKKSTIRVLKDIYYNEGKDALTAGMRQRVTKVTMSCAGILTLYELFSDMLRENTQIA